MVERTEDEKLTKASLTVTLGDKEYEVAPLVIKYSRDWRKNSLPLIQYLIAYSQKSEDDMLGAVSELFGSKTDEIVESFFEYARDLDRDEIEGIATEGEIITAFMEVFNAFVSPLSKPAVKTPAKKTSSR